MRVGASSEAHKICNSTGRYSQRVFRNLSILQRSPKSKRKEKIGGSSKAWQLPWLNRLVALYMRLLWWEAMKEWLCLPECQLTSWPCKLFITNVAAQPSHTSTNWTKMRSKADHGQSWRRFWQAWSWFGIRKICSNGHWEIFRELKRCTVLRSSSASWWFG